ncbi:MAG: hypothetical protein U9R37_05230 [Campylobacterota bacterium]|nr:hypothetical protein [Campylobacterota bacterium]
MIDTSRNMMYHIGNLNTETTRINYQMASGKAIEKGSENSLLHADLINLEDKLRVTEGLKLQIVKSQAINNTADSNVAEVKTALDFIKVDLLKGLNDGMDRSDKLALATNLRGIRDNILDRVNTNVDGEYVFTGSVTTKQTMTKDNNFDLNGKVEFGGDGFLREIAVQPGSYRDRGVTAYDVVFYNGSSAAAGEQFTFEADERIIDENGHEWKLNSSKTHLQKYDHNGLLYDPLNSTNQIAIDSSTASIEADTTRQATKETYTINHLPTSPEGRVFEAKHNYFDDLNVIINALEGQSTKLDGTKGGIIDDTLVWDTLSRGSTLSTKQFDATNIGHGELGGRNNVFNIAFDKITSQESNYNILIQEWGGADLSKLAMESKSLEMTYSALYSTISKMTEMSLINFLR